MLNIRVVIMICPNCNNEVRDYKKVCSYCGHIFEDNLFKKSYNSIINGYVDKYSKVPIKSYKTKHNSSKIIFKNILIDDITQKHSKGSTPEEFTINFYKEKRYGAFFAENMYWTILFLIIYDYVIFTRDSFVYELFSNSIRIDQVFLERINKIDFNSLKNISNITNQIIEAYFRNISHRIPPDEFNNYDDYCCGLRDNFKVDDLIVASSYLTDEQLILIFERMGDDFKYYSFGLPDLIVYNDEEFFFVEVKSKDDAPSFKQIQWHKFLTEVVGIDVVLFMIDKTDEQVHNIKKMYDVELLDSKKRKSLNKETSKKAVFIDWGDDRLKKLIVKVDSSKFKRLIRLRASGSFVKRKGHIVNEYSYISRDDFKQLRDWEQYHDAITLVKYDCIYKEASKLYNTDSFGDYRPTKKQFERNKHAKSLENEGKYSEAVDLYMENVKEKTGSPVTYKRLIYILNKFNRFNDIVNLMDIAIPIFVALDDKNNVLRFIFQKSSAMYGGKWANDLYFLSSNDSKIKQENPKKDKQMDLSSYFN